MSYVPVKKKKKADYVVDGIFQMILSEQLQFGERLPPENELAEKFEVSRITIREAVKELSIMGVISVRQGEGSFICNEMPGFYLKQLLPIMIFTEKNAADLYDARRYIEIGTASLAAINRTEEELIHLESIIKHINILYEKNDFHTDYSMSVGNFHEYVARICKNKYLHTAYLTISDVLNACISKTTILEAEQKELSKEHNEIFLAIRDKNSVLAEKLMSEHLLRTKTIYLTSMEQQLPPAATSFSQHSPKGASAYLKAARGF